MRRDKHGRMHSDYFPYKDNNIGLKTLSIYFSDISIVRVDLDVKTKATLKRHYIDRVRSVSVLDAIRQHAQNEQARPRNT